MVDTGPRSEVAQSSIRTPSLLRVGNYEVLVAPVEIKTILGKTVRAMAYHPTAGTPGGEVKEFNGIKLKRTSDDAFEVQGTSIIREVRPVYMRNGEGRIMYTFEKYPLTNNATIPQFDLLLGDHVITGQLNSTNLQLTHVVKGREITKSFRPGTVINIGATKGNFTADSPTVSREHLTIIYTGKELLLRDKKSKNGTRIIDKTEGIQRQLNNGVTLPSSERTPETNQDAFVINQEKGFAIISDGASGIVGGRLASHTITKKIEAHLSSMSSPTVDTVRSALRTAIVETQRVLMEAGSGGLATLTLGVFVEDEGEQKLVIFHLGDSRLYGIKDSGRIEQLTTDHGYSYNELQKGNLTESAYNEIMNLLDSATSTSEIRRLGEHFIKSNLIYQFISKDMPRDLDTFIRVLKIRPDTLGVLLVTDGVTDPLTRTQIETTVTDQIKLGKPEFIPNNLCALSRNSGRVHGVRSKDDDSTAVLLFAPR